MADHPLTAEILRVLLPLQPLVMGISLYGSQAEGTADERSDRDICLVGGEGSNHYDLQMTAWRMVRSDIYDIRIFELLPLYMQIRILSQGILLYSPDRAALGEYLYPWWKRWDDQRFYQTPIPGAVSGDLNPSS